jgi:hypothetical protein
MPIYELADVIREVLSRIIDRAEAANPEDVAQYSRRPGPTMEDVESGGGQGALDRAAHTPEVSTHQEKRRPDVVSVRPSQSSVPRELQPLSRRPSPPQGDGVSPWKI